MPKFKIALLCGGPSLERAISLNSARMVLDHLASEKIEILPVYFDQRKNAYLISRAQLYSNTPADFDFKLKQTAKPLARKKLINFLKDVNITFPVMHGKFGEDGAIQKLLEQNNLPFIGSPSNACSLAFDKHLANKFIKQKGFYSLPSLALEKSNYRSHKQEIKQFFKTHKLKRAIVKPAKGGSSIAVYSVADATSAFKAAKEIFTKGVDDRVVIEPFCQGKEFTVIILENKVNQPVAILPTEIDLSYKDHQIFDYRKKYLANRQVFYHCPPRFSNEIVSKIQSQAEALFRLLDMRDFTRFDGWLLPNNQIWFSDFNPISGMEQNSFLFMQSSRLGLSHGNLLKYIVKNACRRYGIKFPEADRITPNKKKKKVVNVIFGGSTAERQVSVMSGTNVWLKLKRSTKYDPQPYLLDTNHQVWKLPYTLTLNHTVEEISQTCRDAEKDEKRLKELSAKAIFRLGLSQKDLSEPWFLPRKLTLKNFIKQSPYVFIALHGGVGENGELQAMLEKAKKPFNGSNSAASRLCMNKFATGLALAGLNNQGIITAPKKTVELNFLKKIAEHKEELKKYWLVLKKELGSPSIIVKPIDDGCSSGIARLYSAKDLNIYLDYALKKITFIPRGELTGQHGIIEMPTRSLKRIMFEKFIATDKALLADNKIKWQKNSGWIETTCGLLEVNGKMRAFNPSLTVSSGDVLTLEEKFQGGTGINITPPPAPFVKPAAIEKAKARMEKTAETLGLKNYARVDAFMNINTGELIIIEANTLPGLTPSTVIYHQALAEKPALYPKEFLEKIVESNY